MKTQDVNFQADGRRLDAYLALPAGTPPFPAVVVIQEIWGLTPHIRDIAERFAKAGYAALAPDLYTGEKTEYFTPERIMSAFPLRTDPAKLETTLAAMPAGEQNALTAVLRVMNPERHEAFGRELVDAVAYLRSRSEVDPRRIGSIGFCMGGALSASLAVRVPDLGAAVIFYGAHPPLDAIGTIQAPVLGIYGGDDHRLSDPVPAFAEAMERAGKRFLYQIYPGAPHAFFNDTSDAYRIDAARDAWVRVLSFFNEHLGR